MLKHYNDDDDEVRIAYRPSYPLTGTVANVIADYHIEVEHDDGVHCTIVERERRPVVWIAVGSAPYSESPYAPREAWS